jgi:glycosyltransferase involved in cell wall biosynthesis
MRILLSSYVFPPSVGGIEEVSDLVAGGLAVLGHEVRVLTMTAAAGAETRPFEILRRPDPWRMLRSSAWCDVHLQMHVSLRVAWPALVMPRPRVVSILGNPPGVGHRDPHAALKRTLLWRARLVTCSAWVARGLDRPATVIHNPYRSDVFRTLPDRDKAYDLAFLGRLVTDKGVHLLLDALAVLRGRGLAPRVLIIGGGPEEAALRGQCERLQLSAQVEFAGRLATEEVVRRLNRARIMVMPSTEAEAFGVAAVEGIACGCVLVGSDFGGLPEAIGPCGVTFPNGDVASLADRLAALLQDPQRIAALRRPADEHLARHQPIVVARAYEAVLTQALGG